MSHQVLSLMFYSNLIPEARLIIELFINDFWMGGGVVSRASLIFIRGDFKGSKEKGKLEERREKNWAPPGHNSKSFFAPRPCPYTQFSLSPPFSVPFLRVLTPRQIRGLNDPDKHLEEAFEGAPSSFPFFFFFCLVLCLGFSFLKR